MWKACGSNAAPASNSGRARALGSQKLAAESGVKGEMGEDAAELKT